MVFHPTGSNLYKNISTVTYRIMTNGSASKHFTLRRGLRQGDPLSPYLFLFCMDILSRMATRDTDIKLFQGIQVRRSGLKISHLFFADHVLFFFKASFLSCETLNNLIKRFCVISCHILNLQTNHLSNLAITSKMRNIPLIKLVYEWIQN